MSKCSHCKKKVPLSFEVAFKCKTCDKIYCQTCTDLSETIPSTHECISKKIEEYKQNLEKRLHDAKATDLKKLDKL